MIGRHGSARLGALALALLAAFAGPGACKGTGADVVVYKCRDRAVLHGDQPLSEWFEVEGSDEDPWVISVAGRPGELTAGDVVHVGGLALVLDGPAHHRFFVDDEGGRVSLSIDGGPTRLVGLTVTDPAMLAALSAEERPGERPCGSDHPMSEAPDRSLTIRRLDAGEHGLLRTLRLRIEAFARTPATTPEH